MTDVAIPDNLDERIDAVIWSKVGSKSIREIAAETGIPVDQVMRRWRELAESVDVLSVQEKRMQLMHRLDDIARKTQDDYDNAPYEFKAGLMNSAIAAMKTVLTELNRADKADTEKVNALNSLRVKELVGLMLEVVDTTVPRVAEKYSLDEDEVFAMFNEALVKAAAKRDLG